MAIPKYINTDEIIRLRDKKLTYQVIGEKLGVSKQAIGIRLKNVNLNGLLKKKCSHCEKEKYNVYSKRNSWGRICKECFEKKKRVKKYGWSCDWERCIDCKTTSKIHKCNGRCYVCYDRYRYQTDMAFRKKKQKENRDYARNLKNKKERSIMMK